MTRRGALVVAHRANRRMDVPLAIAIWIALAARRSRVRYALAFAMFQQESNFQPIYGHDAGGLFPGARVTRENYRRFRAFVVANEGRGANGVGLGQVTFWTYIRDHKGLWKRRVQVYLATSILGSLVRSFGEEKGVGAYNGGPTNPNMGYSAEVLEKAKDIRPRLTKKGS